MTLICYHVFKCGLQAKATITPISFDVEWLNGKPTPEILPRYRKWRDFLIAKYGELTGIKIKCVDV